MQGRRSSIAFTIVVTVVMLICAAAMGLLLLLTGAPGAVSYTHLTLPTN